MHTQRYGFCSDHEPAEIVSLRTSVGGAMPKPVPQRIAVGTATPPDAALNGVRTVFFSGSGRVDTKTYQREHLAAGNVIEGPALIEEYASTTVLLPGDRLTVDLFGNLMIEVGNE